MHTYIYFHSSLGGIFSPPGTSIALYRRHPEPINQLQRVVHWEKIGVKLTNITYVMVMFSHFWGFTNIT